MARLHSCNVLQVGAEPRRLWQFDAGKFGLNREQAIPGDQPLPPGLVDKSWSSLWRPRLNIVWLAAERVFLRVVQLPKADPAETRSMVELQLEKLSPLPVTHIVWSLHLLPAKAGPATGGDLPRRSEPAPEAKPEAGATAPPADLQTVIVVIMARSLVEELLGRLERDGFLADRLEVPFLDQLRMPGTQGDGAWIHLDEDVRRGIALVAWWREGVLQHLGFVQLPPDRNPEVLREQLAQMAWAGELEGWLPSLPQCHLVAGAAAATQWQAAFNAALETPVQRVVPPSAVELAALTARRVAQPGDDANLLPSEYGTRYRQQFVDRLWLRGLTAVGMLYLAGVVIYFIAVGIMAYQTGGVEKQMTSLGVGYTNVMQLKARYNVLRERQDLKYAALECWKVTAVLLPKGATLEDLSFRDGSKLTLRGNAPASQAGEINDFNAAMRKAVVNSQPLFSKVEGLSYNANQGNNTIAWSFACELNRAEEKP